MPNDTIPTKICTKCKNPFPATIEYFNITKSSSDGLNAYCKECCRKVSQEWRKVNSERAKENNRQWYQKTRDERRDLNNERWRIHYYENIERERQRAKTYAQNNPDKRRALKQRRRAQKNSLPSTFTVDQWYQCLEHFHYCCAVCGCQLRDLFGNVVPHADHWIPLSNPDCPGTVAPNMICLCSSCNLSKSDTLPHEWLVKKYGKRKANEILKRIEAYFASVT